MEKYICTHFGTLSIGWISSWHVGIIQEDIIKGIYNRELCELHYDNQGVYFLYKTPFSTSDLPTRYNLKDFKQYE